MHVAGTTSRITCYNQYATADFGQHAILRSLLLLTHYQMNSHTRILEAAHKAKAIETHLSTGLSDLEQSLRREKRLVHSLRTRLFVN